MLTQCAGARARTARARQRRRTRAGHVAGGRRSTRQLQANIIAGTALKRPGTPRTSRAPCLFFATEAPYVTGPDPRRGRRSQHRLVTLIRPGVSEDIRSSGCVDLSKRCHSSAMVRRVGRMQRLRRELGQRPEHVGALQQLRPRQRQLRLLADEISVQQQIQVERGGRSGAAVRTRPQRPSICAQARVHLAHRQLGREPGHQIDEVRAGRSAAPAASAAAPAGRLRYQGEKRAPGNCARELCDRAGEMALGLDVAARGDVDLGLASAARPARARRASAPRRHRRRAIGGSRPAC